MNEGFGFLFAFGAAAFLVAAFFGAAFLVAAAFLGAAFFVAAFFVAFFALDIFASEKRYVVVCSFNELSVASFSHLSKKKCNSFNFFSRLQIFPLSADRNTMQEKSFLEVLIDQILAEKSADATFSHEESRPTTAATDWDSSPAYLAYLLAHPPIAAQKPYGFGGKNPYFSTKGRRSTPQQRTSLQKTLPRLFDSRIQDFSDRSKDEKKESLTSKTKKFSVQEQQALLFFHMHETTLGNDFEFQDLKRAYRKLAQKLHPDRRQDGNNQAFIALQRAYEILQKTLQS